MLVKIIKVLIISTAEYKKLFPHGKPESGDLILIIGTVRRVIENILFNVFFEDANEALHCLTDQDDKKKTIKIKISLEKNFYNKHFGNLIPEEREKNLNELITGITEELDKINWREVIQ